MFPCDLDLFGISFHLVVFLFTAAKLLAFIPLRTNARPHAVIVLICVCLCVCGLGEYIALYQPSHVLTLI